MKLPRLTIRQLLWWIAVVGLALSYLNNFRRMRTAEAELALLRSEVGHLQAGDADELAAVRIAATEPLQWQTRVRVPKGQPYRVAYSALWREATGAPQWYSAQTVPPGESVVTVRVLKDPRDDRWKMHLIVRHAHGVSRSSTALPEEIAEVFRGSHDVISTGVGRQTATRPAGQSLRLLDDRYFAGQSLMLYGDRAPKEDVVGVYAELQPDVGPL